MKRTSYLLILLLFAQASVSGKERNRKDFVKLLDYTISYKWDNLNNTWATVTRDIYVYDQADLMSQSISVDINTGDSLSRILYIYDDPGKLEEYYFQNYDTNKWVNIRKYDLEYDENGKMKTLIVIDWKNGKLVYNRRLTDYTYNDQGLCTFVQYQGWNGSEWENSAQEYYYYNGKNILERSESFDPNGVRGNRVFYETNTSGQRTRMLVQNIYNNVWYDVYQDLYTYDKCGYNIDFVRQFSVKGTWVNQQKSVYFWKFETFGDKHGKKIPVCHNGHTIYVSENALKAHLEHGDCIGECNIEKDSENRGRGDDSKLEKPPFTIYPNPATDKITIRFDNDECRGAMRIELTDFYGKLIKSFNVKDNSDLTIYRENLLSGKYYIRLVGKVVYSAMIIFD
jgi:hypothetical protein